jgi:hypothetical protein
MGESRIIVDTIAEYDKPTFDGQIEGIYDLAAPDSVEVLGYSATCLTPGHGPLYSITLKYRKWVSDPRD